MDEYIYNVLVQSGEVNAAEAFKLIILDYHLTLKATTETLIELNNRKNHEKEIRDLYGVIANKNEALLKLIAELKFQNRILTSKKDKN